MEHKHPVAVTSALRWVAGLAIAATALGTGEAAPPNKCQYQSFQVVQARGAGLIPVPADFPPPPAGMAYLFCVAPGPLVGTLNGDFQTCFTNEISIGVGGHSIYVDWLVSRYNTARGSLVTHDYCVADGEGAGFTCVQKVAPGSTGEFAGTTGTLLSAIEVQHVVNPRGVLANVRISGYVCPA